ncbi:tyrosine-type recombinase/integrase [Cellulosilyticum sp. I15G10I2]|uniref:tyrosine-type recombinase/integrase n=1 Tax=Cellulosilyticum sp. I15G10I2 TaxID=1892843 RepID=UPI00085CBEF7|nr:tyrosine-type recombinase/integrase [Cellulosilyticum sp. I15G10I2]
MKLPNGYGSVYRLSGKRRKPWGVRKTAGWETDADGNVKQKYDIIGYYETRQLALQALANYNENPYDLKADSITFSEVYDKWSEEHFKQIVPSATRTWKAAYNYCKPLYNTRMKDIRVNHLEQVIQKADVGDSTKARIKSMFNLLYKYALKHEIVDKDYAALCNSVKKATPSKPIVIFSPNEIKMLWDNIGFPFVDMILIGIYSGWRPQELAILKTTDIDIENMIMLGGLKTEAGKNRYVPTHESAKELILKRYNLNNVQLFMDDEGNPMTYDKYRGRFNKVMEKLNMDHRPHETRHTFITLAKDAKVDEYCLKLMVGHAIEDITEKVYTHRTIEQLRSEINKIRI